MWWSIILSEIPIRSWYCILLQCILYNFGLTYIRKKHSAICRKWVLTILGIVDLFLVCGTEKFLSVFLGFIGNFILIKITAKKYIHISSLMVFGIITLQRLDCKVTSSLDPLLAIRYMHIVMKIIGLGFEIHESHKRIKHENPEEFHVDPSWGDALHYVFSLAGNLGGSYIRYRTYVDSFRLPFCKVATSHTYFFRFFQLCIISLTWFALRYHDVEGYFLTEAFEELPAFEKIVELVINGLICSLKIWIVLLIGEMLNMCAGIGAYPVKCENKTGHGPRKYYSEISKITYEEALNTEVDFKTIACVNAKTFFMSLFMQPVVQQWNMTVQYFLVQYYYKQYFVKSNKFFRLTFTEIISLVWHDINIGYTIFFVILFPFYSIIVEPAMKIIVDSTKGTVHRRTLAYIFVLMVKKVSFFMYLVFINRILSWSDIKVFLKTSKNIVVYHTIFIYIVSFIVLILNYIFENRKKEKAYKR